MERPVVRKRSTAEETRIMRTTWGKVKKTCKKLAQEEMKIYISNGLHASFAIVAAVVCNSYS